MTHSLVTRAFSIAVRIAIAVAIAIAIPIAGCSRDSGSAGKAPTPDRLRWEEPFPAIEVRSIDGAAVASPIEPGRWQAVVLCPKACVRCDDEYADWAVPARIAGESGLRLVAIAERDPAALRAIAEREEIGFPMYATETSIFGLSAVLNRAVVVLVDPAGIVRYIGRDRGTFEERSLVLQRHFRYLTMDAAGREDAVRKVFPEAASITVESTPSTKWLGPVACESGLSPWFGIALDGARNVLGFGLPVDRETNCDVCDPLYLMIGISVAGEVTAIEALDPIASNGMLLDPERFFALFRGAASEDAVRKVESYRLSPQVDRATRDAVALAIALARQSPESGPAE